MFYTEVELLLFQGHLICSVPAYRDQSIRKNVGVDVLVHSSGRVSQPQSFTYTPGRYDDWPWLYGASQQPGCPPSCHESTGPYIIGAAAFHVHVTRFA